MINLLMRFYDVTSGVILVDRQDIRQLSRQDYRRQFGMVLQDAWLYKCTIKENLRFGSLDASDEEIIKAAKAANVDHFIRTLPGGYNMEMNQESSNISLGQKQLLTIARALLANLKIIILDESTSSVDTRLELLIQKAMKRLMKGRNNSTVSRPFKKQIRFSFLRMDRLLSREITKAHSKQKAFIMNFTKANFQANLIKSANKIMSNFS